VHEAPRSVGGLDDPLPYAHASDQPGRGVCDPTGDGNAHTQKVLRPGVSIDVVVVTYFRQNLGKTEKRELSEHLIEIGDTKEYEALHISGTADHTRAFIKIQDGCNQFCS